MQSTEFRDLKFVWPPSKICYYKPVKAQFYQISSCYPKIVELYLKHVNNIYPQKHHFDGSKFTAFWFRCNVISLESGICPDPRISRTVEPKGTSASYEHLNRMNTRIIDPRQENICTRVVFTWCSTLPRPE